MNLTFANHISETKNNDGTLKEIELDFCDTHCYEKFLRKDENKKQPESIAFQERKKTLGEVSVYLQLDEYLTERLYKAFDILP